jgi:hypothetical protein
MQVLPIPKNIRPWLASLPPIYNWPIRLKRAILVSSIILCLGAYILLIAGLLISGALLLELAFHR